MTDSVPPAAPRLTRQELLKAIAKELEYDGGASDTCPKCGHVLRKGNVWFDKKWSSAHAIAKMLPVSGDAVKELIEGFLDGSYTEGDRDADAEGILSAIESQILGRKYGE